jgi:hypothetical protein
MNYGKRTKQTTQLGRLLYTGRILFRYNQMKIEIPVENIDIDVKQVF